MRCIIESVTTGLFKNRELLALQLFNAMRFGTAILLSVVFAKIAEPALIHLYESLLLIGTTCTFFYASAINHALVPTARAVLGADRPAYYSSALLLLCAGSVLSFVGMMLYSGLYRNGAESELLPVYALYVLFNTPALLAEHILLIENRHRHLLGYGLLSFSLQFAVLSIPLHSGNLENGLYFLAILALLKMGYTLLLIRKFGGFSTQRSVTAKLFKISKPVMGSLLISNGYIYLSAFLVKFKSDPETFNVYRYGAREFPLFMILANSFSTVQSGILASRRSDIHVALGEMHGATRRLMHQLFPAAMALALFSPMLFRLAFNPSLAEGYRVFNILLLLLISRVLFPQSILLSIGKTRPMLLASLTECTVGLLLSYWWLDLYGIEGVAWAMVLAHLLDKLVLLIALSKLAVHPVAYVPHRLYILYSLLLILAVLFV